MRAGHRGEFPDVPRSLRAFFAGDFGPERFDFLPERVDFWPERVDFGSERGIFWA